MSTDSTPHSNPAMISEAVRRNGYCGEVSVNGQWVCIKDAGHEDEHGDYRWAGDDFAIVRNYLFDGIGNDAFTRIEEQYGTLRAFVETVALASSVPEHWRETARAVLYPAISPEACRYCAGKGGRHRAVASRFLGTETQVHDGPWETCSFCGGSGVAADDAPAIIPKVGPAEAEGAQTPSTAGRERRVGGADDPASRRNDESRPEGRLS